MALALASVTMMKITRINEHGVPQFLVEGRITQESVPALQASCEGTMHGGCARHLFGGAAPPFAGAQDARWVAPGCQVREAASVLLNLAGVTFADQAGIQALHALERNGVVLTACSGFLNELLRQRSEQPDSQTDVVEATELDLVARLRGGESEAYETLIRRYGARMLATARRLLRSDDDAQDAVQEALLSAFSGISAFSGDSKLSTWLHRIVVNAALMKLRRRRRKPEEPIEKLLPRFNETGEWADGAAQGDLQADVLLARRETRALVRRCIEKLPDSYRTVLMLRDIEDLDTDETAARLRLTPNAVKIRLHRAHQALRTLLEPELVVPTASPSRAMNAPRAVA